MAGQGEEGATRRVYQRQRVRPTASARREREREAAAKEIEEHTLALPGPEPAFEVGGPSTTTTEEETYPFPGGPEDDSLLFSYKAHVACQLWKGDERAILKTLCHTSKLLEWKTAGPSSSDEWKQLFIKTGLSGVPSMSYGGCNKNLVAAFVERWHPETNTFHLPFGEMTITLDDVLCLTGLSVEGLSVRPRRRERTKKEIDEQMRTYLRVTDQDISDARGAARGSSIRLEWLHTTFATILQSGHAADVALGCRAYLLYLFGCTLFTDKSGNRVPTSWMEYLEDVDSVHRYAWGTAMLAYMYRQLGAASRTGCKQMGGYPTLLEAWICERFPSLRCAYNVDYVAGDPLAFRWSPQGHAGPSLARLQSYRETLDLMTAEEVIWCPYDGAVRARFPFSSVTFYRGCITAHDVVEPYNPDRVLRQFGYVQTVPDSPIQAGDIPRGDAHARVLLGSLAPYFDRWRDHVMADDYFLRAAMPHWECVPAYMTWYRRSSHPIIQNPEKRSSGAWRPATTDDPWQMISRARDLLGPDVERWRAGETSYDWSLVMPLVCDAYDALDISAHADEGRSQGRSRRRARHD